MDAILNPASSRHPKLLRSKLILIAAGAVAILLVCYGPNAYRIWGDVTYIGNRPVAVNTLLAAQTRDLEAVATCAAKAQGAKPDDKQSRLDDVATCLVAQAPKLQTSQGLRFAAKTLAILKRDPAEQSRLLRRADALSKKDGWLSADTCRAAVNMQNFWMPWFFQLAEPRTFHCE